MQEWDRDAAIDADSALQWMGWESESEEPFLLRRYDVQIFVWYQLPRKFLAPLGRKRAAASGLARFLELLGGRAAQYAEVCRSSESDRLLVAWEKDDPRAPGLFRGMLDASGIDPPDTDVLEWGAVMGLEEAHARDEAALALEEALEDGRLAPGERGFERHQAELARAALRDSNGAGTEVTRLEAVRAERLERWLARGFTRGSAERRAIVGRVAAAVRSQPAPIGRRGAEEAVAPALWLLGKAEEGIALTQTGALNRALVRASVERWPDWWDTELFGPPNREDEVALLHELHGMMRTMRLVRRRGRRVVATARGRKLRANSEALLDALSVELLAGETFAAAVAELAAALLLDGAEASSGALAAAVHPAIVAEGWSADGEPPDERDVAWHIGSFLLAAESVGVITAEPRRGPRPRALTTGGRFGLHAALRARALAPVRSI